MDRFAWRPSLRGFPASRQSLTWLRRGVFPQCWGRLRRPSSVGGASQIAIPRSGGTPDRKSGLMRVCLRVLWHHTIPDEPVVLFSEILDGWEVRKAEVCADGRMDAAGEMVQTGSAFLSETPLPPIAEIASDEQFTPAEIIRDDFEAVWVRALRDHGLGEIGQ